MSPLRMLALVVLAAAVLGSLAVLPAGAVICTLDAVPAATLLLPYFEVDLSDPDGLTTLFSVNNASATAVLVHVVLWSDLSVPVLDFDVYLTGYDVQSVNLRDILVNGNLPQTASDGQDPADTISPQGRLSQDVNFASCDSALPLPRLPAIYISHLQSSLTGLPSALLGGNCAGQALGDNIARGYVTMDTVVACSTDFPGDAGYFGAGGTGLVSNQNVLWGDWFIVDTAQNLAEGGDLVHVEASATDPATSTAGRYTFYGRYDAWTAIDNREPLAANFATRYIDGGPFGGGTSFLVWRDSKVAQGAFTCQATAGVVPVWYPLGQEAIAIFDEQERVVTPATTPVSPQPPAVQLTPFPAEAQRTVVGGAALQVPFSFGWMDLDLNTAVTAAGPNPPVDPAAAQAWVVATFAANGHYGVGVDAIRLDSACGASHAAPCTFSGNPADPSCRLTPPQPPVPASSFTFIAHAFALDVFFTDTSAGNPTSWFWNFGDLGTSTLESPVHTYALPGTYVVTLTVANAAGSSTSSQFVTVPGTCSAAQTPAVTSVQPPSGGQAGGFPAVVQGGSFIPADDTVGFDGFLATPGPGSTTTALHVTVPAFTGAFPTEPCLIGGVSGTRQVPASVDVTVLNGIIDCSGTLAGGFTYEPSDTSCLVLPPSLAASFTVSTASTLTAIFTDTSTGSPTAWVWDFGDGTTSLQENPVHTYSAPGTYLVKLTVTNVGGSSQASEFVTVPGP
jgi:PKD repeat protein